MRGLVGERIMGSDPLKMAGRVRFGENFELDLLSYELRRAGRVQKLERIPAEILLLLVEQRGQLVTREQIIERIWGKDVFVDTDNSINAAIRKIRQVLKDDPEQPRFLQTVIGRGYRFIAPVHLPAPLSPPPHAVSRPLASAESSTGAKLVLDRGHDPGHDRAYDPGNDRPSGPSSNHLGSILLAV